MVKSITNQFLNPETYFPEGNLQNIISTSPTQRDYNIRATEDLVENVNPFGVVGEVVAPAAAGIMSLPYDAIQAATRTTQSDIDRAIQTGALTPRDIASEAFGLAYDRENPLSSAIERAIGAAGPLANRISNFNAPSIMGTAQAAEVTPQNEPLDIEDFLGTSTPQDLGFIGNAPTIREAVAPIGITDRGRGMAGPAVEMIGGQAVPVGDVLGRQMALEKADFFEEPKSKLDAGGLLSLIGLITQSKPIQLASMIANRDKIGRGIGKVKSGIGSLSDRISRKMRGVNPDGTTRTQSQYEQARTERRQQKRTDRMIDRITSGKRTSKNPRSAGTTKAQKDAISAALRESRRGQQYTDKDSSGSSGTGGGKVVCTMMNERYGFGSFRNKIWMKFHESYGPEYQKGYHAIFLPLVKIAKGEGKINTAVRKVLEHMGRHVTADMFKIMKGKKRDTLGRIYRAIFEPTCRIIGKIKSALGRG